MHNFEITIKLAFIDVRAGYLNSVDCDLDWSACILGTQFNVRRLTSTPFSGVSRGIFADLESAGVGSCREAHELSPDMEVCVRRFNTVHKSVPRQSNIGSERWK